MTTDDVRIRLLGPTNVEADSDEPLNPRLRRLLALLTCGACHSA